MDFEQATELDPDNATAWLHLARVAARLGLASEAQTAQRRGLELDPQLAEQNSQHQQPTPSENAPAADPVAAAGFR
ncbi:MAG UNVERIFIED_CONTAM: tetratricopeptide repeat protein [Planctomycetaceae bacterium]